MILIKELVVNFGLIVNGDIMHFKMLDNVLKSTMSWFGTNQSSRIVFRFTVDQNTVDQTLKASVITSIECIIRILAGLFIFNLFYYGL